MLFRNKHFLPQIPVEKAYFLTGLEALCFVWEKKHLARFSRIIGEGSGERKFDFKNAKQQQKVNFTIAPKAGKHKFELKSQMYGHPSPGRKQLIAAATPARRIDFWRNS